MRKPYTPVSGVTYKSLQLSNYRVNICIFATVCYILFNASHVYDIKNVTYKCHKSKYISLLLNYQSKRTVHNLSKYISYHKMHLTSTIIALAPQKIPENNRQVNIYYFRSLCVNKFRTLRHPVLNAYLCHAKTCF